MRDVVIVYSTCVVTNYVLFYPAQSGGYPGEGRREYIINMGVYLGFKRRFITSRRLG